MSDDRKPAAARSYECRNYSGTNPALVQTVDGEEYAADHTDKREGYLRIVNFDTDACEEVVEVVDLPHHRITGVQRYPLADCQQELVRGGADL